MYNKSYKSYFYYRSYRSKEGNAINAHEGKYAWTVKVGEKGQFVIPKQARDIFGIKPGDTLIVLADAERGIAIPPKNLFSEMTHMFFPDGANSEKEN